MSKQAVRDFRRYEAQRVAEVRAKKRKKKEDKRRQVDANDVKRKEKGVRSAPYNSSRYFSTPSPIFAVGDQVTNRPITAGKKLLASREDWIVDSVDGRKANCTNMHNPAKRKEWEWEYLEHKTASVGDMNRSYTMKTLERDLLKRVMERKEEAYEKKTRKLQNIIQQLQTKVDALSKENDKMKVSLESHRAKEKDLLNRIRDETNQSRGANKMLRELQDGLDDAYNDLKSQIKV